MELVIRAWDLEKKEMTPEMPFFMACGFFMAKYSSGEQLSRYVVMLFTGLHDDEGRRIFDQDIVEQTIKTPHDVRTIRTVMSYNDNLAQFGSFMDIPDGDPLGDKFEVKESVSGRPHVIGNKFQNENLLYRMPRNS